MKRSYRGDRSMAMKKISCIIPCYNEEAALPYFLREIRKVADQMSATDPVLFEILFVNDGSKDRTLETCGRRQKRMRGYVTSSFSRNFGKEAAMYAGFKNVTGDYAAVMDADMQDPPSLLPEMYRALQSGGSMIRWQLVVRTGRENRPFAVFLRDVFIKSSIRFPMRILSMAREISV